MNFINRVWGSVFRHIISTMSRQSCQLSHTSFGQRSEFLTSNSFIASNWLNQGCTQTIHTISTPGIFLPKNKPHISLSNPSLEFVRTYKTKTVLKLRCSSCYFVKRKGRLFVECPTKPRHKQMQKMNKARLYKEDLSSGNVVAGVWFNWKRDRWYREEKTNFDKSKWLGDSIAQIQ